MTTKKTYSKEFKEEAVRLAQQQGNQSQTARDLGLQISVLRRWIKEFNQDGEKAFPGKGHTRGRVAPIAKGKSTVEGDCRDLKKGSGYGISTRA